MELITKKHFDEATPVNAKRSSATLTISGVVLDSETFTIGTEVYEFAADTLQTVTAGNIAVDITAVTTKSQGELTVDTQPTAGNTMRIGDTVYTFRAPADTDAAGEISIGTDLATAQAAIFNAVNGLDGLNIANPVASIGAFAGDKATVTARVGGVAGDSIITSESFTANTNIFDAGTLGTKTAGADASAADAVTKIVAEITAHSSLVTAVDGAGNTVVITSVAVGTEVNDIGVSETMAQGSWGAQVTKMSGGLYCTPVAQSSYIIIGGVYYIAVKGTSPVSEDVWYSASPSLIV